MIRVLGQDEPCDDIPVWEHRKRYARLTLRPLISLQGQYLWGPYSTQRAGSTWADAPRSGCLPTDLQGENIQKILDRERQQVAKALVDKTLEIVNRYTSNAKKEVELHTLDKTGNHPLDLGDYDVLAVYPEKNVVLNIECKDLLPAYCFKDAKRLRERIFGRPGKDSGEIGQVIKRQEYLSRHLVRIAHALDWPMDANKPPKVLALFITRHMYWWTRFPPEEIEVEFLRVDLLSDFLANTISLR